MNISHYTIDIQGSKMGVAEIGSGPAVILASGYLFDNTMWDPQVEMLSSHCRVIVPDLWGHGRSGAMPAGTNTMIDLARHHTALLDRLEIETCSIVGLSLGGMWAAELALLAPKRVAALALLSTSLAAEPLQVRQAYQMMLDVTEHQGSLSTEVVEMILDASFSDAIEVRRPGYRQKMAARLRTWDTSRMKDSVVPLGRIIFNRRDALDDLAALTVPVIVATGELDRARPEAEGRAMAARLGCEFISLGQVGHIANLEAPELVTDVITKFLKLTDVRS